MAAICHRCALRLHRAAALDKNHLSRRAFTSTRPNPRGSLPVFVESSNAELNEVLSSIRDKHFIPAYLRSNEQKLVFKEKYRQQLEDNPTTALIGDEEIKLQWIDRRREIPNRGKLVSRALNLILEGNNQDWKNLPLLLQGLNEGPKRTIKIEQVEKVVRKAILARKFSVIIQCLQQSEKTGMTLKEDRVLKTVVYGLHELAQGGGWSEGATRKALGDAHVISLQLESENHGSGRKLASNDPRTRPEVLGVFLELAAVYSYKFADGKDEEGLVKAYAGRLISCLHNRTTKPQDLTVLVGSRQWPMLEAISIWHGLALAKRILGDKIPQASVVTEEISDYELALSRLATELEERQPLPGGYDEQALKAWRECIRG